ncbi:MAG: AAA-like domain-containing protein [Oscillospiraceae bacterium]|nr:AAA-like domain-containing protein [Oscillospiraceae bacterium]
MRRFNVTGVCVPEKHYMVDIGDRLAQIKKMVDYGDYFTINRARQYGKTTTLSLLEELLKDEYIVTLISFEGLGDECFESAAAFCHAFIGLILEALEFTDASDKYKNGWKNKGAADFMSLGRHITEMCKPGADIIGKKLVLMIDEVDKTSNNRTFLSFLGMLRDKYLKRERAKDYTFHSVILAGVYDIKNIKQKMMSEGSYALADSETGFFNSPWNIASNFKVDMSFSPSDIATMLSKYEADHATGMDIPLISDEVFSFTSGYPFLVSRICQCIDEELGKDWTAQGVQDAAKIILGEKNTLFDDICKNLENNKDLYDFIYGLLVTGGGNGFNIYNPIIDLGHTYGFLKKGSDNKTVVSNRIFEILMYDYFISKDSIPHPHRRLSGVIQRDVFDGERFDMELCLRKFAEHYGELFNERDAIFIEREGRLLFLSYLKPLINGQGFYHIESQFTDQRRMDIVVDFGNEQFIIELKLWKGEAEHSKAYEQLAGYMDSKNLSTGFLLTFDFRKNVNKQPCADWIEYEGKRIFDVVV